MMGTKQIDINAAGSSGFIFIEVREVPGAVVPGPGDAALSLQTQTCSCIQSQAG